jgi:hypothetical protein
VAVVGNGSGNPIVKMFPKVRAVAAAGCTVFLCVEAAQFDRTLAWALPAVVYLVATVMTMTPLVSRRTVYRVLTAVLLLSAIGIALAFFFVLNSQPSALFFGAMFFMFALMEMLIPTAPKPA